ncbi:hypothetical protein ACFS07_10770 [Undibacterium arcticum]
MTAQAYSGVKVVVHVSQTVPLRRFLNLSANLPQRALQKHQCTKKPRAFFGLLSRLCASRIKREKNNSNTTRSQKNGDINNKEMSPEQD